MSYPHPSSVPFREYVRRLVQLHQLIAADQDEGTEGDALRDEMDLFWHRMTPEEIEWAGRLSEELYSLDSASTVSTPPPVSDAFRMAYQGRQWDRVLDIVKENEAKLPGDMIAVLRGTCWAQMHFPEIANAFFRFVHQFRAMSVEELVWFVTTLLTAGETLEALELLPALESATDPRLWLLAAEVLSIHAQELPEHQATEKLERSVALARKGLSEQESPGDADLWRRMQVSAWLHLAFSLESLGRTTEAESACLQALELDPANKNAYALLGWLRSVEVPSSEKREVRAEILDNIHDSVRPFPIAA